MRIKKLFVVVFSFIAITANALEFPAKPYASWSKEDGKEFISQLDAFCENPHPVSGKIQPGYGKYCGSRCDDFRAGRFTQNEMVTALLFTASRTSCWSKHLPADYPYSNIEGMIKAAEAAYSNAKKLECKNCPTFSPN